jgi:hypothetical protein
VSDQELLRICDWVTKGAKLYFGSDAMGRRKIKVVRGPLGVLTKRFQCSESDVVRLRKLLAAGGLNKAA